MTTRLQVLNSSNPSVPLSLCPTNPSVPLPLKNIQKNPMKKIVLGVSTILSDVMLEIQ